MLQFSFYVRKKLAVALQCDTYVPKRVCKLCCADPQLGTPYSNLTEIKVKKCSKCKTLKEESCFSKHKGRKDGLHNECKECVKSRDTLRRVLKEQELKEKSRDYYIRNREKIKSKAKIYRENNPNKIKEYMKNYVSRNKDYLSEYISKYVKVHRTTKPHLYAAKDARRRASKLNATPPWLTKQDFEQIKELYEITKAFKLYTGEEYHVDHIIPLQGENVCGLHVPWNLQVISAKENLSKHNKLIQE